MKKVIILEENETHEIATFLGKLEAEEKKHIVRGNEPAVNMELLKHYKDYLWKC